MNMINIDGVDYDKNTLSAEIRGTITLLEHARSLVQNAQMDLAIKAAAHTQIGTQLRQQLSAVKKPNLKTPTPQIHTPKTTTKTQPRRKKR